MKAFKCMFRMKPVISDGKGTCLAVEKIMTIKEKLKKHPVCFFFHAFLPFTQALRASIIINLPFLEKELTFLNKASEILKSALTRHFLFDSK